MMILGGIAELIFGVRAEGQPLESIAKPLTVEDSQPSARSTTGVAATAPW